MNAENTTGIRGGATTRRQMIACTAIGLGGLAGSSRIWAHAQQSSMQEAAPTAANAMRTSLHQEIDLKASPQRIYEALLDSTQFAAFTGMPAQIDSLEGGAFSMFGGMITGRNVELIPNQRIVQAWRPGSWDPGVYSIAKFDLKPTQSGTTVILDHTGFPEGKFDGLDSGWHSHYWEPLTKFLATLAPLR